jgi:hypothetical protein
MSNSPFKPPEADMKHGPPPPGGGAAGSPVKAVVGGLAVDLGGSMLLNIVLSLLYAASVANSGMSQAQMKAALANIPPDSIFMILAMVLGACCSVAGGYVCARIVRRDEYRVGGVMAALSAFLSLLSGPSDLSSDLLLLETLSTIACVLLGVKYGRARNRRPAPPPVPPAGSARP